MPFFVQDREHLRLSEEFRLRAGFAPPASSSVRSQWLENGMGSEALCQHPLLTILNARAAGQRGVGRATEDTCCLQPARVRPLFQQLHAKGNATGPLAEHVAIGWKIPASPPGQIWVTARPNSENSSCVISGVAPLMCPC
jgi:hypothetical protein